MTPESLNRDNSKWPEVKIIFIIDHGVQQGKGAYKQFKTF
jgi:hypothetical protein